jgi:flagellar biosynthesis/type III secretory pathway ATPase
LAAYERAEDLINLGAYAAGSNPKLDAAIRGRDQLMEFLRQDAHRAAPLAETLEKLCAVGRKVGV